MGKRTREERKSGIDGVARRGWNTRRNSGKGLNHGGGGDATQRREFRAARRDLALEGRGQNRQGGAAEEAGPSGGRGLCAPPPTLSAVTASRQPALAASLPPERSCGAGRAGADPGNPDAAAQARGRGDQRGAPAAGAATMEFRQEEFRKLAGRTLGRLHR